MTKRGSGRTTKQLLECPEKALFITSHLNYTKDLIKKHNIQTKFYVESVDILNHGRYKKYAGIRLSAIILDHYLLEEGEYLLDKADLAWLNQLVRK